MAEQDPRTQVLEKVEKAGVVMLTTAEQDGTLVSRPMGVQQVEQETGVIWFLTRAAADAAQDADGRPVNVTVAEKGFWASVAGTGTVIRDEARKKEYWSPASEAFFGEGASPEDPQIVLVRVQAESAEYWASGAASTLVEIVKAKVTGGTARPGEHETVQF
ncbi:pyridoxamine 5'-phosphate oxidase family protein [Micrococcus sp.]|uniref:pyridoxamine 5'-phosphate oxidase family protein n=1 Tax=Micrococcus sp. TaxID=1271 RepID=UPI002A912B3E|nr:pyridoxamine 5'-phosphate oxidase family protein [Micrococcus sp.]MDY6054985.1 pyridoxamine 5'-phosphate oxidase family protein [Micrococcus sp.]